MTKVPLTACRVTSLDERTSNRLPGMHSIPSAHERDTETTMRPSPNGTGTRPACVSAKCRIRRWGRTTCPGTAEGGHARPRQRHLAAVVPRPVEGHQEMGPPSAAGPVCHSPTGRAPGAWFPRVLNLSSCRRSWASRPSDSPRSAAVRVLCSEPSAGRCCRAPVTREFPCGRHRGFRPPAENRRGMPATT